eukprot:UN12532
MGMAIPEKGSAFHGVLHKLTREEMKKLDKIEGEGYVRVPCKATFYDGTRVTASVYSQTPEYF